MVRVTTSFIDRLKGQDGQAWLELWEVFGPSLERMVSSLSRAHFTPETRQDIRQETLLRAFEQIGKFDATRGVRFSTWLYGIAKHIVLEEVTRRSAQKRNRGTRPASLEADPLGDAEPPPAELEKQVFRAKVYHAIQLLEKRSDFIEFEVYKAKFAPSRAELAENGAARVRKSNEIARRFGISEASVSRYLRKARERLREALRDVVREYSWTADELAEVHAHRLDSDDDEFDAAVGDVYAAAEEDRRGERSARAEAR